MEETPPVTLLQCSKSCVPKPSPSKSFQYVPEKKSTHLNFEGFVHDTFFGRTYTYIYHFLITEPNEEGKDQQQASPVPDPATHLLKSQTYQSWLSYQQSNANRPFSQMSDGLPFMLWKVIEFSWAGVHWPRSVLTSQPEERREG